MKLTAVLIAVACLQISAAGFSQNITISGNNVKLERVLSSIEKQSGYFFLYKYNEVKNADPVNLKLKSVPLKVALDRLLAGQLFTYSIEDKTIVISKGDTFSMDIPKPPITVRGKVVDEKGQPLPGASIRLKGAGNATVTDVNGDFILRNVNTNDVIVVSFIGFFNSEATITGQTSIQVVLKEDLRGLNEVVVVGFGTQTKATSVAAVSTVTAVDLIKAPVGDVTNAVVGRMAGVMTRQRQGRPGASTSDIYIRGRASNNSVALIIVDGVERETFGDIDPSDIESISTLKDAASTALFGLKGANGVIVVTTKRGIEGAAKVTYSTQFGINTFGQRPKPLRSYEAAVLHNEGEDNMISAGILPAGYLKFFTPADIEMFKSGKGDPLLYPDVDWFEELTQDSWPRQQHNLSLRGGSKKVNYFVSVGYMYEDGMFKHFDTPLGYRTSPYAKRTNFRSNLDYKITPTTTVSLNLGGRIENEYTIRGIKYTQTAPVANFRSGAEAAFKWMYIAPSWSMPFDRAATARRTPDQIERDDTYNQIIGVGFGGALAYQENPYINLKRGGYTAGEKNILESTFMVNQKLDFITKGLDVSGTFSYDQSSEFYRTQAGAGAVYTVDRSTSQIVPAFANPATIRIEDPLNSNAGVGGGLLKTNMMIQANYKAGFNNHNVSGALVATRQIGFLTGTEAPRAFQGLVFRSTYNFNDKYYTEFNGSYQGSENFDKGYRYGFFPTVGLGYTLSNEGFMKNINSAIKLDYLKIRGSIGMVGYATGNISLVGYASIPSRFLYLDEYAPAGSILLGNPTSPAAAPLYTHSRIGNPSVTFEKGLKRNIGIDANFLDNRVQIVADLFDEQRTDILMSRAGATFEHYGEGVPIYNYGENYNGGVEAELKLNNRSGAFGYGMNFQFSHIKNKRIIMDEPINIKGNLKRAGSSIGQFFAYDVEKGFFQNQAEVDGWAKMEGFPFMPGDIKLKDVNKDGLITAEDYTSIGYSDVPIDQYSLEPHISFKGFSLSALFQAVDKVSSEFNLVETDAIFIVPQYYEHQLDRWTPQTPNAKYPAIRAANIGQNRFFGRTDLRGENTGIINAFNLQDASYIKLRNISLHYAIPQKMVSKLRMSQATVSLTAQNLYTWTNFVGLDPENGDDLNVGTYVNRGVTYPNIRTYQINLSITL
ncbi:MAG: TonB-dependent receptor [Daejeonella sp.]|uniref:TonB-dependent receptor n=1 Tax=Daejeonella sp. JGW-45 TaxID=3034148 RepID=UPI0023EBF458|nr:TonB-dependent receptor [Daejeonella sp. JGW-45]